MYIFCGGNSYCIDFFYLLCYNMTNRVISEEEVMMMFKKIFFITVLMLSCSLSSCSSKRELVDMEQMVDNSSQISISDTRHNFNRLPYSLDGRFLYSGGKTRVDLGNKIIEWDCDIVGCDHWSDGCQTREYKFGTRFLLCEDGGRYEATEDTIYFRKDGKKETIYKNTYLAKGSEDTQEGSWLFNLIPYDDNQFIVAGDNFLYLLDKKTKGTSQPIDVCEASINSVAIVDYDTLAITNINFELILVHLETQSVEKISDYAELVQTDGSVLYFMDNYQKKNDLVKYDLKTKRKSVLAKNISAFCIYDSGILFGKNVTLEDGTEATRQLYYIDVNGAESNLVYTLDTAIAGEGGFLGNIFYFPGYDKIIAESWTNKTNSYGCDYVLFDLENWSSEYIMCDLPSHNPNV